MIKTDRAALWLSNFIRKRRLVNPDRRPLWRYRITSQELEEAGDLLRRRVARDDLDSSSSAQLFVLFAAEYWRRHYDGKEWRWDVVLKPLNYRKPYQNLYGVIELGIARWRRRLLTGEGGRQFLNTLIAEGGFPLHLVTHERNKLRTYFSRLLKDYRRFHWVGYDPQELAEELGRQILPVSSHREGLFLLAGDLVREVWHLQGKVDNVADPITHLDAVEPGWRERLPLELKDETAEALLGNLVRQANELARIAPARIRIRRRLHRDGPFAEEARLEAQLELPPYLEEDHLRGFLQRPNSMLPSRLELLLQRPDGGRLPIAVATRIWSEGRSRWRVERLRSRTGFRFQGVEAAGSFALWLAEGNTQHGPFELIGDMGPDGSPWSFVAEDGDSRTWVQVGQGTVARREPELWVVSSARWIAEALEGDCLEFGSIACLPELRLSRIAGRTRWRGPDGVSIHTTSLGPADSSEEFRWFGRSVRFGRSTVFQGTPKVAAYDAEDSRIPWSGRMEWRPVSNPHNWKELDETCLGEVFIRIVDDGALRCRQRLLVTPEDFEVGLQTGRDSRRGEIFIRGLAGGRVGVDCSDIGIEVDQDDTSVLLEVTATGAAPREIPLVIQWPGSRRMALSVPFPSRSAVFVDRKGEWLKAEDLLTVDRLSGAKARATSLDPEETFSLSARLQAADMPDPVEWVEPLPRLGQGHFELDLGIHQERFRRMLTVSRLLGAFVSLRIESNGPALRPHSVRVARFEAPLELDKDKGTLWLPGTSLEPGGIRPKIEVLPLWQPDSPPILLEPEEAGEFRFAPARRKSGPWLLIGWEGEWCRYRPTLWTVGIEGETVHEEGLTALQEAVRIPDGKARSIALCRQVEQLAEDANDPGWALVDATLERQRLLPAGTFEVLRVLVGYPKAAVAALLRSKGSEDIASVWSVLEELPFSWRLVTLDSWRGALDRFRSSQINLDSPIPDLEAVVDTHLENLLHQLEEHRPFLKPVSAWLRAEILGSSIEQELLMPAPMLEQLLEQERQHLCARIGDGRWPRASNPEVWLVEGTELPEALRRQMTTIQNVSGFKRPILLLPLVAAFSAAFSLPVRPELLFDLQRLKTFDSRYFNLTYEYGLRLALCGRLNDSPSSVEVVQ